MPVVFSYDVGKVSPNGFVFGVAAYAKGHGIDIGEAALGVYLIDDVVGLLYEVSVPRFALLEHLLGLLTRGDFNHNGANSHWLSICSFDGEK